MNDNGHTEEMIWSCVKCRHYLTQGWMDYVRSNVIVRTPNMEGDKLSLELSKRQNW